MSSSSNIEPLYDHERNDQSHQKQDAPGSSQDNPPEEANPHRGGFIAPPGSNYGAATLNGAGYGSGLFQDKYRGYYGEIDPERSFGTHYQETYGNPDNNWIRPTQDLVPELPREEDDRDRFVYHGSDERLGEQVNQRLREDPALDTSQINIHVDKGRVVINGKVETKQDKYHLEDRIASTPGVVQVENHLKVSQHSALEDFAKALTSGLGDVSVGNNPRRKKEE